jgi:hypothetical protein
MSDGGNERRKAEGGRSRTRENWDVGGVDERLKWKGEMERGQGAAGRQGYGPCTGLELRYKIRLDN